MKNMKKLVGIFAIVILFVGVIGCVPPPIIPDKIAIPSAGVYFIPATAEYNYPQIVVSDSKTVRLGSSSQCVIKSLSIINSDTVDMLLENNNNVEFDVRAGKLPISSDDYGVADFSHPYWGLYSSVGGQTIDIFAVKDTVKVCRDASIYVTWLAVKKDSVSANLYSPGNYYDYTHHVSRYIDLHLEGGLMFAGGVVKFQFSATPIPSTLAGLDGCISN